MNVIAVRRERTRGVLQITDELIADVDGLVLLVRSEMRPGVVIARVQNQLVEALHARVGKERADKVAGAVDGLEAQAERLLGVPHRLFLTLVVLLPPCTRIPASIWKSAGPPGLIISAETARSHGMPSCERLE